LAKAAAPPNAGEGTQSTSESTPEPPKTWRNAIAEDDFAAANKLLSAEITKIVSSHDLPYEVLLLFDAQDEISNYHLDQLYEEVAKPERQRRDILLVLHTRGGSIEPAYLLSKTLKRFAETKFVVVVPRRAKSAGTLICLGADEVHMGMISQLGPIDPQSGGLPVLAVANALEAIAELAGKFPAAAGVLTKYLTEEIPIRRLGYYQRVAESAVQYAQRLLDGKVFDSKKTGDEIATHLVNHYKDHSFAIDFDEATSILGRNFIKTGTKEYRLADELYRFLASVELYSGFFKKYLWVVGSAADGFHLATKRD
jgi:hypothetical protein